MNTFEKILKKNKDNFNFLLDGLNYTEINKLVDLFIKHKSFNIYFSGVGKSGNLAIHLADLFKSIGLKTFTLNVMNSTHGDLGCVEKDDLIIFLSKSGNTKEINDIVDVFNCAKILVCCNDKAKISSKVDNTYIVPLKDEGDIYFKSIPSNSISHSIIYFNVILNLLIEKLDLSLEQYRNNHPAGDIGFKNKKISDFISNDIFICNQLDISVKEVMNLLKTNKMGLIFEESINNENLFYGIITTKDILKIIDLDVNNINSSIKPFINRKPILIDEVDCLISSKINLIREHKFFKFIPVVRDNKYIGIIDNSKILKYL